MRLIDADRLLDKRMQGKYYHLPNGDVAIPIIDIEHAPTVEAERTGKWIPCSERLPEEKKEVLISADGELYIAEYEIYHGKGYWSEVIEYRNVTDVDAWMPLPEPYGGEQE